MLAVGAVIAGAAWLSAQIILYVDLRTLLLGIASLIACIGMIVFVYDCVKDWADRAHKRLTPNSNVIRRYRRPPTPPIPKGWGADWTRHSSRSK